MTSIGIFADNCLIMVEYIPERTLRALSLVSIK
ncbi:hypothetical protein CY0110_19522 [Crocosphaera chwakensis CCY0110]|uniref:Uncharacterized protein n=1 Tax=Crocosphaera chwakensis CCY0110 TaxID=391612 RepID=A3IJN6_9CHRO|nr:hypothetical protein CY0110_19522 [Crocosphaera chwakensis CCY0110]